MSTVKAVVRHVMWNLAPNREPDAEPTTYKLQCVTCSEESERSKDWEEPQTWALTHSGRRPSHQEYREHITRPWRTWMSDEPRAHS